MYKLIAIWSAPKGEDVEAFEEAYNGRHGPLAAAVPGIRQLVLTRTDVGLEDAPPAFFRVAEMIFDSQEALEQAEHSDEWRRLREDAGGLIERFGVTLSVGMGDASDHPVGG